MTNILFYAGLAIFSLSLTSISFLLLHGKSENTESLGRIGKNLPAGLRIHTQRDRLAAAVPPHSGRHVYEQGHRRNEAAYRRRTQRAGQRQPERLHGRSGTRSGARRTDDPPARGGRAHEDTARLQPFYGPDDRQVFPADHPLVHQGTRDRSELQSGAPDGFDPRQRDGPADRPHRRRPRAARLGVALRGGKDRHGRPLGHPRRNFATGPRAVRRTIPRGIRREGIARRVVAHRFGGSRPEPPDRKRNEKNGGRGSGRHRFGRTGRRKLRLWPRRMHRLFRQDGRRNDRPLRQASARRPRIGGKMGYGPKLSERSGTERRADPQTTAGQALLDLRRQHPLPEYGPAALGQLPQLRAARRPVGESSRNLHGAEPGTDFGNQRDPRQADGRQRRAVYLRRSAIRSPVS